MILDALALRQEDIRLALVDKVNAVSHASLTNFDWKAKVRYISCMLKDIGMNEYHSPIFIKL